MDCEIKWNDDKETAAITFTFADMVIDITQPGDLLIIRDDIQTKIQDVTVTNTNKVNLFYTKEYGYTSNQVNGDIDDYQNSLKQGIDNIKTAFNNFTDVLSSSNTKYEQLAIHSKLYFVCMYTITILTRVFVCTMIDTVTPCSNTGNVVNNKNEMQNKINQLKSMLMDTSRLLLNMDNVETNLQVQTGGKGDIDIPTTSINYTISVSGNNFIITHDVGGYETEMTNIDLEDFLDKDNSITPTVQDAAKDKLRDILLLNINDESKKVGLGTINMNQSKDVLENIKSSLASLLSQIKDDNIFKTSLEDSLSNSGLHKRFLALVYIRHAIYKTAAKMYVYATVAIKQHSMCTDFSVDELNKEYNKLVELYKDTTKLLLNIEHTSNISNSSDLKTQWPSLGGL